MSDFVGTATWIFTFLIMTLLPVISVLMFAYFLPSITEEAGRSLQKFMRKTMRRK